MIEKEIKKVYSTDYFRIRESPNDWTNKDIMHITKVLIRRIKKRNIKLIEYKGLKRDSYVVIPFHKRRAQAPDWVNNSLNGSSYMKFEITYETEVPRTTRKLNIEDIIEQLVMESL